jgi:hypothetical protein
MKPRKQIREFSEKRAAKLAAKGVKLYGSSIAPSSKPKKARKAKPIGRGPMMQRRSKPIAKVGKQKAKREATEPSLLREPRMAREAKSRLPARRLSVYRDPAMARG